MKARLAIQKGTTQCPNCGYYIIRIGNIVACSPYDFEWDFPEDFAKATAQLTEQERLKHLEQVLIDNEKLAYSFQHSQRIRQGIEKKRDLLKEATLLTENRSAICPHCGWANPLKLKAGAGELGFTYSKRCRRCKQLFKIKL